MNKLKMLVLVLVAILATSDALAEGIDCPALGSPPIGVVLDKKLAHELFKQAQRYYDEGKFREAAAAFVASYHGSPDEVRPALIYNVGKAMERSGDLVNAAAVYRCYLTTDAPEEFRQDAAARIELIEQAVPPLQPESEPPAPEATASAPIDKEWKELTEPTQPRRVWTWIAAGVTGAVLATGIGFGISSDRKFRDLENRGCAATSAGCPRDEVQAIERNQLIANIAFGVAGAGALATGVLWFWERRSTTVGVKINPNGASAMIRW